MSFVKNIKLPMRLVGSFCIIALLTVIVGGVGVVSMRQISVGDEEMYKENLGSMIELALMYDTMASQRICLSNHAILFDSDPTFAQEELESLREKEASFEEALELFEKSAQSEEEKAIDAAINSGYYGEFKKAKEAVIAAVALRDNDAIDAAIKHMDDLGAEVSGYIDEAFAVNDTLAAEKVAANGDLYRQNMTVIIIITAAIFALSVVFGIIISRSISAPLGRTVAVAKQAGETGNLHFSDTVVAELKQDASYRDEVGQMVGAFAAMMDSIIEKANILEVVASGDLTPTVPLASESDTLGNATKLLVDSMNTIFSEVDAAAGQVSTGAAQIADGAQMLASASTEQAATVEQLSASIGAVATKTQDNAEMADRAAQLADGIRESAEQGSVQMGRMIEAVQQINQSSQAISSVIAVIDNIAFQTNILALNASVEAARAGQHGKGFAVVAEEVRSLASKSAEAAQSTSTLIAESVERTELGTRIAKETSESLEKIVSGVKESAEVVAEIAQSSEDQNVAVEEINRGIEQLSNVVQQNSATAQQSAASSEEMSSQSALLREQVSRIKLKKDEFASLPRHGQY